MPHRPELRGARLSDADRRRVWGAHKLLAGVLAAYVCWLVVRHGTGYSTAVDGWMVDGFELVVAGLCLARSTIKGPGRGVAFALGLGLLSWCMGDVLTTIETLGGATPPSPSFADAFYLGFYPLTYTAIALFMRAELRRLTPPSWLDGVVAGLGAAAVCAAFAFHAIVRHAGGSPLSVAMNIAYPTGDLLLLALVVGGTAVLVGRSKTPWLLFAGACALNATGDTANLFHSSIAGSRVGTLFDDVAWPAAFLLMTTAVWLRAKPAGLDARERTSGFLLPGIAAASAFIILFVDAFHRVGDVAIGLATLTLVLAGVRLGLSARSLRVLTEERRRQSVTDELTGLGNRRHLFNVLDAFFADQCVAGAVPRNVAFVYIDLNHFKQVNDSFGHHAGDELLRQLGPRLTRCLREGDVLVRLGGDEFAVALLDADGAGAKRLAGRLAESLLEPFRLDAVLARVDASMGISIAPQDATDTASLMRCADAAMYRAKLGQVPFEVYVNERDDDGNRLRLVEELREAVDGNSFVLYYQPQLDISSGEVLAVEALLRWPHPRLGLVPPLDFIPLAEEAGLMPALTALVLNEALAQSARWRSEGHEISVSVNASPSNLLDQGFAALVQRLLLAHDVPPSALVLEITESCLILDFTRSALVIEELRALGVVVSIDDFGAGVTSLAHLSGFAVGELKLDRVFVTGLASGRRPRDLELVRSTIELGHAVGMRVVAEGIEDSETLSLLEELGCDVGQGYFIGRPLPAHEIRLDPASTRAPSIVG